MWRTGWAQRWHFQLIDMLWVTLLPALKFSHHHVGSDQNSSCTFGIIYQTPPESIINWVTKGPWLTSLHTLFLSQASKLPCKIGTGCNFTPLWINISSQWLLLNYSFRTRLWLTWEIQCTHSSLVLAFEQWQTFQGLGVPNVDGSISSNLGQRVNWDLCPQKFTAVISTIIPLKLLCHQPYFIFF